MDSELPDETSESFEISRHTLQDAIRMVDGLIAASIGHPSAPPDLPKGFPGQPSTEKILPGMLQALGASSNTLVQLSEQPGLQSRDCFTVCRSIVELAINICYICAGGDKVAKQAERHAYQKSVLDMDRKSSVGGQTIYLRSQALDEIEISDEGSEMIKEFTSSTGREKGWTDLSVDARCERIGDLLGDKVLTPLHWARFSIYRHSSEILHGTLFGVIYFMTFSDPRGKPSSPREWLERIAAQHLMVLMAAILSIVAVARAVSIATDVPALTSRAQELVTLLRDAPFFRNQDHDI